MKNRTFQIVGALILIASMLLSACQPQTTATQEQATKAPETSGPIKLTYSYRITSPAQEAHIKWVIESFNEKFAGKIQVTGSGVDDETYKTKMAVELRGENPPDIFYSWEGGRAKSLIDAGYSHELDEYYAKYGWEKTLNPAGVALATFGGKKYFVPYEMAAAQIWYRPSIFEKYNLTVPQTWDEMKQVAETLKANGVAPFVLTNQKRWPAQFEWSAILVNKHGLQVYQDLLDNKIPWTDARVVDAFAELKKMADEGWYYPGINSLDLADGVVPFGKGEAAMWYQGTWMPGVFQGSEAEIPFDVDFFLWPQMGSEPAIMEVFAENTLMMHAKTKYPDAAAEFLNYFVSLEVQTAKTYDDRPYPANVNVDLSKLSPMQQKLAEQMKNAGFFTFMHVDHAFDPAIANAFLDAAQALLAGAMTPEQAAQATEAEAVKVRGPVQ